ncbi:Predicted integral membrane protein [Aedoeadaptatus ivorii]|uniref:Predicted integral membrane protein n=1 Tax=Aedoeadaptatus ivorii TaxID=54006 RepID=A0A448V060_9FIRM|nr:VanZ family protein [Peptoniphilus ivorii]MDQ0507944.1 glycopeptide antibiotics resistance protein [Peptoniphilus ivorii]VEJ34749.1 Predicted integral membrane protein [Peptoniphilus ivorii]
MIRYICKMTPIIVLVSFLSFSFLRAQCFGKYKKKSNRKRERLLLAFSTYCLWILFFLLIANTNLENGGVTLGIDTATEDWRINLVPFATMRSFRDYASFQGFFLNVWGNVLIAIPLGFATPILFRRFRGLLSCLSLYGAAFLAIETLQYFVGRSADIDDWILNMCGILIGYGIAKAQRRFDPRIYNR